PLSSANDLNAELYSSSLTGLPRRNGFNSELTTNDMTVATADTGDLGATNGAVRMSFNSTTKVITVFYDLNVADGYQWVEFGSFGVAGPGAPTTGDTDWGLADTDQFPIYVYGFSTFMVVTSGQMYADNFIESGGVQPSGALSTVPTGSFHFGF